MVGTQEFTFIRQNEKIKIFSTEKKGIGFMGIEAFINCKAREVDKE